MYGLLVLSTTEKHIVQLHEDDLCQFYYPDRTEKESVPFDTLAKALKRNNGSIINAFRRLTPVV